MSWLSVCAAIDNFPSNMHVKVKTSIYYAGATQLVWTQFFSGEVFFYHSSSSTALSLREGIWNLRIFMSSEQLQSDYSD